MQPGNTLRAVGDRSLRWECHLLTAAQSLGSAAHHSPFPEVPANTNHSAYQLPSNYYLSTSGRGHVPVMSSEMRLNPQSLLRLTRTHFKRTISTAVCTVSVGTAHGL